MGHYISSKTSFNLDLFKVNFHALFEDSEIYKRDSEQGS